MGKQIHDSSSKKTPLPLLTPARRFCIAVVMPLLLIASYAIALWLIPSEMRVWFNSEYGPVEIVSAFTFLAIGLLAVPVYRASRQLTPPAPRIWQLTFAAMAAGGILIFFEEISWGQHFIGWDSPDWFVENSKQAETNLHNLFEDRPSKYLRRIAEIGIPIFAIILPLISLPNKSSYRPGNWPYYLLPRAELIIWVLLAGLVRPVRKWTGLTSTPQWRGSLSEFQELLWAGALLVFLIVLLDRFRSPQSPSTT